LARERRIMKSVPQQDLSQLIGASQNIPICEDGSQVKNFIASRIK
jgi:hypothetical protein